MPIYWFDTILPYNIPTERYWVNTWFSLHYLCNLWIVWKFKKDRTPFLRWTQCPTLLETLYQPLLQPDVPEYQAIKWRQTWCVELLESLLRKKRKCLFLSLPKTTCFKHRCSYNFSNHTGHQGKGLQPQNNKRCWVADGSHHTIPGLSPSELLLNERPTSTLSKPLFSHLCNWWPNETLTNAIQN